MWDGFIHNQRAKARELAINAWLLPSSGNNIALTEEEPMEKCRCMKVA